MQTEMHHIRTLRIMSEVYSKGLQKEVPLEQHTAEKMFPALDDLLDLHSQLLQRLLDRKKESQLEGGGSEGGFVINRIGDILVSQVRAATVYTWFCTELNEVLKLQFLFFFHYYFPCHCEFCILIFLSLFALSSRDPTAKVWRGFTGNSAAATTKPSTSTRTSWTKTKALKPSSKWGWEFSQADDAFHLNRSANLQPLSVSVGFVKPCH